MKSFVYVFNIGVLTSYSYSSVFVLYYRTRRKPMTTLLFVDSSSKQFGQPLHVISSVTPHLSISICLMKSQRIHLKIPRCIHYSWQLDLLSMLILYILMYLDLYVVLFRSVDTGLNLCHHEMVRRIHQM